MKIIRGCLLIAHLSNKSNQLKQHYKMPVIAGVIAFCEGTVAERTKAEYSEASFYWRK